MCWSRVFHLDILPLIHICRESFDIIKKDRVCEDLCRRLIWLVEMAGEWGLIL